MSPLSNSNSTLNSEPNQVSSNSAFKPLPMSATNIENIQNHHHQQHHQRQGAMSSSIEHNQYNSEMAYASYSQMNTAASPQDYHNTHQQQVSLGAFKREHDELTGYTYPRPVKLYEHAPMEPYAHNQVGGFRNDAPSPGASIIDLSTSSVVTSLRAQGFSSAAYYDGQRYDRSPQSASSPHYSSPQMLSPQGQTLDLSVGRTSLG